MVPYSENIFQEIISAEMYTSNFLPETRIAMILIAWSGDVFLMYFTISVYWSHLREQWQDNRTACSVRQTGSDQKQSEC